MGTNFYGWKPITSVPAFCLISMKEADCGDPIENQQIVHLGKAACGWRFLAQWNDGRYYTNKEEYQNFVKELQIFDEFGNSIDFIEFADILTWKGKAQERNTFYGIKNVFFGKGSELEFGDGNWS